MRLTLIPLMIRRIFLIVAVLFLLGDVVLSQDADREAERRARQQRREKEAFDRQQALFNGPPPAGTASIVGRSFIYSVNRGFGNTMAMLGAADNKELRDELGFSEEQEKNMRAVRDELRWQMLMKAPQYADRFKKMASGEDPKAIQQDIEKELQAITDKVEKIATPEQKKKAQTVVFQGMGGLNSPLINVDAMSALDLTEEQKKKAQETLDSMEKERLEHLAEGLKLFEKAVQLGGPNMSPEDRQKLDEERKALEGRIFSSGQKIGDQLRSFLTEEQREKEKILLANRPKFLPRLPRQMRGESAPDYRPDSDSWRPGQGNPDENKDRSKRRPFPKKEKTPEQPASSTE